MSDWQKGHKVVLKLLVSFRIVPNSIKEKASTVAAAYEDCLLSTLYTLLG